MSAGPATAIPGRLPSCYATGRRGLDQVGGLGGGRRGESYFINPFLNDAAGVAFCPHSEMSCLSGERGDPLPPLRLLWATASFGTHEEPPAGKLVTSRRSQVPGDAGGGGRTGVPPQPQRAPSRGRRQRQRGGGAGMSPCHAAVWSVTLSLSPAHGLLTPPHPELVGAEAGQSRRLLLGGAGVTLAVLGGGGRWIC